MSNILIADSGSTKTHWLIKNKSEVIREFYTKGLNPYFVSSDEVVETISEHISKEDAKLISQIYFYGAGCKAIDKRAIILKAFIKYFPESKTDVNGDLLGAAIALFGNNAGVACILGTGSNASVYDGDDFVDSIYSLGYILGDQGSGAYFGKVLLRDYFQHKMPKELADKFKSYFDLDYSEVLHAIYKQQYPNKYLAKFTVFLSKNRGEAYVEELLINGFQEFVNSQIKVLNFDKDVLEIGFVGSIAFYFKNVLEYVLIKNGYKVSKIIKEPMDGLKLIK